MTYLIEYLGEFEFIFETVLGYVSGDQMGSFKAKKRSRKSHDWAPLNMFKKSRVTGPSKDMFGAIVIENNIYANQTAM